MSDADRYIDAKTFPFMPKEHPAVNAEQVQELRGMAEQDFAGTPGGDLIIAVCDSWLAQQAVIDAARRASNDYRSMLYACTEKSMSELHAALSELESAGGIRSGPVRESSSAGGSSNSESGAAASTGKAE